MARIAAAAVWWCAALAAAAADFTELAARAGLAASRHRVTTEDGYILNLYRLAGGARGGRPVLLMHGFLASGDTWLDAGGAGLARRLAADCDLWVGNFRGTYDGRAHAALDPDADAAFWEFSLHELGYYDLPALVDAVLRRTGRARLAYVGHSLGAGALLVLAARRPELAARVSLLVALAPAARLRHARSAAVRGLGAMVAGFRALRRREVFDRRWVVSRAYTRLCAAAARLPAAYRACAGLLAFLDTEHPGAVAGATMARLYDHFPAGVSLKMLSHFEQLSRSKTFDHYDHGAAGNRAAYGRATAPAYNLSRVTVPTVIIHGRNDHLTTTRDTVWLRNQLPNVVDFVAVADPQWNHVDFVLSKDIPTLLYPLVRDSLLKYGG